MATKQASKINQTSLQVLKTLQVLLEDNYEMTELVEKLNSIDSENNYNSNIVSKYINSCRYCGCEIPKIHNKYYVASIPFGLNLTFEDLGLLGTLQQTAHDLISNKIGEKFDELLAKISKFSNKKLANVQNKNQKEICKVFDDAITNRLRIRIMLKNRDIYDGIPLQIVKNKNKTFFYIHTQGKEKPISVDRVVGIESLEKHYMGGFQQKEVVFKVMGSLSERYTLKDGERILEIHPDYKVISNTSENKEVLFSRLLRYDSCCEILKPIEYREEMKEIIKKTLENYGV